MADLIFNRGKSRLGGGDTLWDSATLKVMLVTSAYTPNADDDFVSTAVAGEITATNYTGGFGGAGRKAVTAKSHAINDGAERADFLGTVATWVALGGGVNATIVGAVLFEEITSDAASPLVAYFDFADVTTNGGDFSLSWSGNIMLQLA